MDPLTKFSEIVDRFIEFTQSSTQLRLVERLISTRAWLAAVYQGAALLDATDDTSEPFIVDEANWAPFGNFEEFWALPAPHSHEPPELRKLSLELNAITNALACGLYLYRDGHHEQALNHWCNGFESEYGPRIVVVLPALHVAVQNFRTTPAPRNREPRTANIVMLDDTAEPKPGVVGLRLQPVEGGAAIAAVHPMGPAKDLLLAGDLVLAVDDEPIHGETPEEVGLQLRGECQDTRVLTIFRDGETLEIPITLVAPEALQRELKLRVLLPAAAERAATALTILGCAVELPEPELLLIRPAAQVSPEDVDALVAAGESNGIWVRTI